MPEHIVPMERITSKIYIVRDTRVMLDRDLAELYGVETRTLKQAVRRNLKRFPADFMFELSYQEFRNLTSQSVTSSWGGVRRAPMAFTQLRQMLATHEELKRKIEAMERKYDEQFSVVFEAIKQLMDTEDKPKRKIGFQVRESGTAYSRKSKKKKG